MLLRQPANGESVARRTVEQRGGRDDRGGPAGAGAAVGNLLQNAVKFTRPHTTVTLRARASAGRVLIEVQDECGGLPGENFEALFRPFAQRGADRTGLGLGLAISRGGIAANNGRVSAQNLPDCGCIFTVDLPQLQVPAVVMA